MAIAETLAPCPSFDQLAASPRPAGLEAHVRDCAGCRLVDELLAFRQANDASLCERVEDLLALRDSGAALAPALLALLDSHTAACTECRAVANTLASQAGPAGDHAKLPAVPPAAYALGRELARGGMGRILEARDLRVGRPVAVKELLGSGTSLAMRFEREARVTARLQHPGIVPIYEIGTWPDGTPFYAMRLIEGTTLGAAIAKAKTLEARLALLPSVIAAAEAIAFAHARHVIHRDLTPSNVMLGEFGETVVIDWGLSKDLTDDHEEELDVGPYRATPTTEGLTAVGAVIGTAAYMPPEQAAGESVDERGDVYALGALLYQVLAGAAPYKGKTSAEILERLREGPPSPVAAIAIGAPRDLVSIVDKAMARDPANRYPSAKELVEELRRFQTGRIVEAHAYSRGELMRRWLRRHRALVLGASAVVIALAIVGVLWLRSVTAERAIAMAERDRAAAGEARTKEMNVRLLEEQGRQHLLAGDELRALAFFDEAMQQGLDTPELRLMIGMASAVVAPPTITFPCGDRPRRATLSPDTRRLAVLCERTVKVWDVESRRLLHEIQRLSTDVWFSRDGRLLALGGAGAAIYEVETGKLRRDVPLTRFAHVAVHGDTMFALTSNSIVIASHTNATEPVRELMFANQTASPNMLTDAAVGVAMVARVGDITLLDLARHSIIATIPIALEDIVSTRFSRDGSRFVACTTGGVARVWDTASAKEYGPFTVAPAAELIASCALDSTGHRLLVVTAGGHVQVFDATSGRRFVEYSIPGEITGALFIEQARAVVVVRSYRDLELRTEGSGHLLSRHLITGALHEAAADERFAVVGTSRGVDLVSFDLDAHTFEPEPEDRVVASNLAGDRVLVRARSGTYRLWDVSARKPMGPTLSALTPSFSIDDEHVIGTTDGRTPVVVDVRSGRSDVLPSTDLPIDEIGCDATCARVYIVMRSATQTRVWDRKPRIEIARISGNAMTSRAMSRDGRQIIVTHADRHEVWEVSPSRKIDTFGAPTWPIGFDRTGRFLAMRNAGGLDVREPGAARWVHDKASGNARMDPTGSLLTIYSGGQIATYRFAEPITNGKLALPVASMADVGTPIFDRYDAAPLISPDEHFTLDRAADGLVQIRSARDGRVLVRLGERRAIRERREHFQTSDLTPLPHWSDVDTVVGFDRGLVRWKLKRDRRSREPIHRFVQQQVPWRFEAGRLTAVRVSVSGRVLRAGEGVHAALTATMFPNGRMFRTDTDDTGAFRFDDVPMGADLEIEAHDVEVQSAHHYVRAGGQVDIELPALVEEPYVPYTRELEIASPDVPAPPGVLIVRNERKHAIELVWLNFAGKHAEHTTIEPGSWFRVDTYEKHRFLLREVGGPPFGIVVARDLSRGSMRVVIR